MRGHVMKHYLGVQNLVKPYTVHLGSNDEMSCCHGDDVLQQD